MSQLLWWGGVNKIQNKMAGGKANWDNVSLNLQIFFLGFPLTVNIARLWNFLTICVFNLTFRSKNKPTTFFSVSCFFMDLRETLEMHRKVYEPKPCSEQIKFYEINNIWNQSKQAKKIRWKTFGIGSTVHDWFYFVTSNYLAVKNIFNWNLNQFEHKLYSTDTTG